MQVFVDACLLLWKFCPEFQYSSVLELLLKEACNKSHLAGWSLLCALAVIMPSLIVLDKFFGFFCDDAAGSVFKLLGFAFFSSSSC